MDEATHLQECGIRFDPSQLSAASAPAPRRQEREAAFVHGVAYDQNEYDDDFSNATRSSTPDHGARQAAAHSAAEAAPAVECCVFDDYNAQHMGAGVSFRAPRFYQGASANAMWQSYDAARQGAEFRPVRTMVYNIPIDLFSRDSQRFHHWNTPHGNSTRGCHVAAILGMAFTGTSKGFPSGEHEELKRANGQADADLETDDGKNRDKLGRVFRYAFVHGSDNNVTVPMFVIAYQELYNTDLSEVVAIRVFDKTHSDSELWRKLMDENQETFYSAGAAHSQNSRRKRNMLQEQKYVRAITGGAHGKLALEYFAGTQYTRITNESGLMQTLKQYGGKNIHHPGLQSLDWNTMPPNLTTKCIDSHRELGGVHPLSPEYAFNARREMALRAGLIDFTGHAIDVHADQLKPELYFSDSGDFRVPGVDRTTGGFFLCIDSSVNNIFDCPLPRPIYSCAGVGSGLLQLYSEVRAGDPGVAGSSLAMLSNAFHHMMTAQDCEHTEMARQMQETVLSYDSIDLTDLDRQAMRMNGVACYGDRDEFSDAYVIEPRQKLKEIQVETRRVQTTVIEPWLAGRRTAATELKKQINDARQHGRHEQVELLSAEFARFTQETKGRHHSVVRDLVHLHISRIENVFLSKMERTTVPAGYCAMFDGLKAELDKTTNNSASIAFVFDEYLTADDISVFAHVQSWLGAFFEHDTFGLTILALV